MGIERVTPRPAFYANESELWDIPAMEAEADKRWQVQAKNQFYLLLPITMRQEPSVFRLTAPRRRQIAQIIACVTKKKAVFEKRDNCYHIGSWSVGDWTTATPLFSVEKRQSILSVLDALDQAGYGVEESIKLYWIPSEQDIASILAISELTERENEFLKQVLQLKTDMRFVMDKDAFSFDIALAGLSAEAMNRALLVIQRMILHVMEPGVEKRALVTSA